MAIQFTEAEMLILSSLGSTNDIPKSKYDANGYPIGEPVSINDILGALDDMAMYGEYGKNGMSKQDQANYEAALSSLKEKLKDNDFVITKSINHNTSGESGFAAFAIEPRDNPNGEVIICTRGSDAMKLNPFDEENTLNDWLSADVALAWEEQTQQQAEMEVFMQGMESYNNISLVGHSLGGNLAMYGAVTFPYPNKIAGVYSFDGPGFNLAFIHQYCDAIEKLEDRIYNYQQEHDVVSSSFTSIGEVIILDAAMNYDGGLDFDHHNRWAIAVDPDQRLRREPSGEKGVECDLWHTTTSDLSTGVNIKDVIVSGIVSVSTSFCRSVSKKYNAFVNKHFNDGYKKASENTYININTTTMRDYASRLAKVNLQVTALDTKINNLYGKVGLRDLLRLIQADILLSFSLRLYRCSKYLEDTAADFEAVERSISNQI